MMVLHTLLYALIFIACLTHLNRVHGLGIARTTVFSLTIAGSGGSAIALWCPRIRGDEPWWELMFHAGVAGIAIFHFGIDRRKKPVCPPNLPPECLAQIERRFQRTP